MLKKFIHISFLFLFVLTTQAQDLHFSQYFNAPLLVNPANTGFTPDYDYRVGAHHRNQWASVGNPYRTQSIWGDLQLLNNKLENGWLGIGGAILQDVAGSSILTGTRAFGTIAYHQMLGARSLLSGGFGLGWVNKRIDLSKLTFDNQWNGKFFDNTINPNEPFATNQTNYLTLSAGLNYSYFPTDNLYLNIGLAANHINRPSETFYGPTAADTRLDVRYTAFANMSAKVDDRWIVNSNMYVSQMANAWETVIGVNTQRSLNDDGSLQLIMGGYYRVSDAIIPMVGFNLKDYRFTINYDATVSSLGRFNNGRGAYEISIVRDGIFSSSSGRAVKCPSVRF